MRYPLCDRTVTVYRLTEGLVRRFVLENCFYRFETKLWENEAGLTMDRKCLLVIPGSAFVPQVGDRVFDGVGPEEISWNEFLPVFVESLSELNYVKPQYWLGKHCHTEAGRT